jgi:hypothetical protein
VPKGHLPCFAGLEAVTISRKMVTPRAASAVSHNHRTAFASRDSAADGSFSETLRQMVVNANETIGADRIVFNLPAGQDTIDLSDANCLSPMPSPSSAPKPLRNL